MIILDTNVLSELLRPDPAMAHLLASSSAKYKAGDRPNAEAIGRAVNEAAQALMPNRQPLFTRCRKSDGGNPDHAWVQGSEL